MPDRFRPDRLLIGLVGLGSDWATWVQDPQMPRLRAWFGNETFDVVSEICKMLHEKCEILSNGPEVIGSFSLTDIVPDRELSVEFGESIPIADEPRSAERLASLMFATSTPSIEDAHLALGSGVKPKILVVGIGGAGSNAVFRMTEAGVQGVELVTMSTDADELYESTSSRSLLLGEGISRGLGTGGRPEIGKSAAEESQNEVRKVLDGADVVFITAGMGGGTGTGAAPVVARLARELGALTIAVITRPFGFEGRKRSRMAETGVTNLMGCADTIITIDNDKLLSAVDRRTTLSQAFRVADDALRQRVQGISDMITIPSELNVEFADVRGILANAGPALMGIGYGEGDARALLAAENALNDMLFQSAFQGAKNLLVNITCCQDLTVRELSDVADRIQDRFNAEMLLTQVTDSAMVDSVRITIFATGKELRSDKSAEGPHFWQLVKDPAQDLWASNLDRYSLYSWGLRCVADRQLLFGNQREVIVGGQILHNAALHSAFGFVPLQSFIPLVAGDALSETDTLSIVLSEPEQTGMLDVQLRVDKPPKKV